MPKQVVVAIDIFPDNDLDHACASVRRVGDGKFRVNLLGEDSVIDPDTGRRIFHDFATRAEAITFALEFAVRVELDPNLTSPASVHLQALLTAEIEARAAAKLAADGERTVFETRILALEAQLAAQGG